LTGHGKLDGMPSALRGLREHQDWSDRRVDARRNPEQVTAAALAVFAERGLEATVPEIAARAGVGKATVYRSFPAKSDLVAAVARHHLTWLSERLEQAATAPDAYAALQQFVGDLSDRLASDRSCAETLPSILHDRDRAHAADLLAQIVASAKRDGHLRSDVTVQDIHVLVGGYARALLALDIRDPAQWRRYADLALNALRP
jgi:AcrR family transcriptional regulator